MNSKDQESHKIIMAGNKKCTNIKNHLLHKKKNPQNLFHKLFRKPGIFTETTSLLLETEERLGGLVWFGLVYTKKMADTRKSIKSWHVSSHEKDDSGRKQIQLTKGWSLWRVWHNHEILYSFSPALMIWWQDTSSSRTHFYFFFIFDNLENFYFYMETLQNYLDWQ